LRTLVAVLPLDWVSTTTRLMVVVLGSVTVRLGVVSPDDEVQPPLVTDPVMAPDAFPEVAVADGVVAVGADMMTARPGIFAGGDIVAGARTLTDAIGHGKRAARAMDAWMAGHTLERPARHALATPEWADAILHAARASGLRPAE